MLKVHRLSLATALPLIFVLGGCSSAPKPVPLLDVARAEYSEAALDVALARHAPEMLDHARNALNKAETRWRGKDKRWRVEHYAYIARQRMRTASLIAERNATQREMAEMESQRQYLTLGLREVELKRVRAEARNLKRQMAALQAQHTDRGMVLTLGDVLFETGKSTLLPASSLNIDKIAEFMRTHRERIAIIEGHTDSIGERDFNIRLSRDRARAVKRALVEAGVSPDRLTTQAFGESLPIASNTTAQGRQMNRRVEMIFPDDEQLQLTEFDEY